MRRSCSFWPGYTMFNAIGAFTKQFTPIDGGYLYFPSKKSGGKLVTADEFQKLVEDWERTAGRKGQWKMMGIVVVGIILFTIVDELFALPDWTNALCTFTVVVGVSGRLLWASFAPRRLVSERAAITQPRPISQVKQEVRALLNWPFIIIATLIAGAVFGSNLSVTDRSLASLAWLIGSGIVLGLYLWIGFQKLMDRQR